MRIRGRSGVTFGSTMRSDVANRRPAQIRVPNDVPNTAILTCDNLNYLL